ncbi:MAG: response regulator, partial [Planctomycetota bacterium]|nr:response regulator [Planctomycetota bacterium]
MPKRDDAIDFASTGAVVDDILVIDGDPEHAKKVKKLLESIGRTVVLATDGGQAHSSFMMHKPDFVIIEFVLPGESGYEICEWIKRRSKATPILALTDVDLDQSRQLASRVGVDGYMVKPYEDSALLDMVARSAEVVWQRVHAADEDGEDEFGK